MSSKGAGNNGQVIAWFLQLQQLNYNNNCLLSNNMIIIVQLSQKKKKAMAYHAAQRQIKCQGQVARPQDVPENKEFAQAAKVFNMGLGSKDTFDVMEIINWELTEEMRKPFWSPHLSPANKPVHLIDNEEKFGFMIEKLQSCHLIGIDLEGSESHTFLDNLYSMKA